MNKTLMAVAATLTGVAAAGSSYAWNPQQGVGPKMDGARPAPEAQIEGRMAALESILTLKDNQKQAFKDYVDSKTKFVKEHRPEKEDAFDVQARLEGKAMRMKEAADMMGDLAAKRAALWSVLDPQQKLVLETYETQRMVGDGDRDEKRPPEMQRAPGCGCPAMMGAHHGWDRDQGPRFMHE